MIRTRETPASTATKPASAPRRSPSTPAASGLFTSFLSYGLRDALNGSSNTIAFAETMTGPPVIGYTRDVSLTSVAFSATSLSVDVYQNLSGVQAGIQLCTQLFTTQTAILTNARGRFWANGNQGEDLFNTIVTPNSLLNP